MTVHTLGLTPALDVVYVLDGVRLGEIHRPPVVIKSAGGKSLNVARALALLGVRARAIAPLGGHVGDLVAALIADSGVELDRVPTGVETRMCVTACDTTAGALTEFYEPALGFDVPLGEISPRTARIVPGEWLTVSGSVPAAVDPGALADILAADAARGVRLAIDVHGPALGAIIAAARPTLVKVNLAEAAELTGASEPDVAARALVERGAQTAVVTLGTAGAVATTASGESASVPAAVRPGLFSVGSGDCFLAGLVAELARGANLAHALEYAAAVGAANAQVPGAAVFAAPPVSG